MSIGEKIRLRREQLGMSQTELARLSGYKTRSAINKIENDGRNVSQEKINAIARALRVTPSYLMGWEEEEFIDNGYPRLLAELTAMQEETLEIFFSLNATNQQVLHNVAHSLLVMQEGTQNDRTTRKK